ncbi:copper homeostasis protein CutC [Sphingobacterium hotanense]|uniref:PF03932 family protein CutC n=1 Tax=Sphingobacterium hotanense TaxID=649196 RepID=A0ABT7NI56_9SPHI|nr:copper homeostasis protein CutC [Sphingobacterium hotanense]MDM1046870.1 copper homeostasis protein CutC [Sphingobacterium hotanense]
MIEKSINGIHLEICANSLSSAKEAQLGGASRVELCQNLENGGTTPSYGQIKLVREALEIGVHVLIRPRAGDFLYSDDEFAEIKEDILYCKEAGCDGVVIGILTKDGGVDKVRMQELVDLAKPMCVVFHRAFDRCAEPLKSLEDIIELGCDRILTSGLKNSAWEGRELIKALVDKADGRIEIMPGAGVDESNVKAIIEFTGVRSVHSSAKVLEASKMVYNQTNVKGMDEDVISSSSERVAQIIEQIKSL